MLGYVGNRKPKVNSNEFRPPPCQNHQWLQRKLPAATMTSIYNALQQLQKMARVAKVCSNHACKILQGLNNVCIISYLHRSYSLLWRLRVGVKMEAVAALDALGSLAGMLVDGGIIMMLSEYPGLVTTGWYIVHENTTYGRLRLPIVILAKKSLTRFIVFS